MENNLLSKSKLQIWIKARQDNILNLKFLSKLDPLKKLQEEIDKGTFDIQTNKKEESK